MGGTFVASAHESGGIMMADGYSRETGRVGVASVTHGPGVTNSLTALTEAVRGHSALVVLTGDPLRRDSIQWLALETTAQLAGAVYVQAGQERSVPEDLVAALHLAAAGHRAVLVNLPAALITSETDDAFRPGPLGTEPAACVPEEDAFDRALGIAASA
jgi:acetolactate synthase-1/2/3 large subunit